MQGFHSHHHNAYTINSDNIPIDTVGYGYLATVYDAANDDEWTFGLVSTPDFSADDELLPIDPPLSTALVKH